ncbi:MAG: hypothetical protein RL701_5644 [Pseudomonadota bacterium]
MGQIGIKLDPQRKEPLHRQIFDQVAARIESRAFPAGYRLPPSRELSRELGAHRNTVARAYADLEAAGFVYAGVGRGTFVSDQTAQGHAADPAGAPAAPSTVDLRELPWAGLLSHAASGDLVGRAQRHVRATSRKDQVNLARMQPSADLIPDALLRRCLTHVLSEQGAHALGYAPPEGVLRVREQIALDLAQRGVPARADEVLLTSGSQQGLDLIARSLINPGDAVLIEPTTYSGAIDVFTLAGARLVRVPMDEHGPDPHALARLSRQDVKALYLMPNAHNPTGRTLGVERRHALVAWSRNAGVPIIEDDYAAGIALEASERTSPAHLRALDADVIHLSTFSKCLAPGLRLGYLVAPARLLPVFTSLKRMVDLGASLPLQHALAEFMERGYLRAHRRRIATEYRQRRDALHGALSKLLPRNVDWELPSHGVVLWLRLPSELDAQQVYEEALRRGVLVSPSSQWSAEARPESALRLTFCAEPPERLEEGARRLAQAIKQLLARRTSEAADAERPVPVQEVV